MRQLLCAGFLALPPTGLPFGIGVVHGVTNARPERGSFLDSVHAGDNSAGEHIQELLKVRATGNECKKELAQEEPEHREDARNAQIAKWTGCRLYYCARRLDYYHCRIRPLGRASDFFTLPRGSLVLIARRLEKRLRAKIKQILIVLDLCFTVRDAQVGRVTRAKGIPSTVQPSTAGSGRAFGLLPCASAISLLHEPMAYM